MATILGIFGQLAQTWLILAYEVYMGPLKLCLSIIIVATLVEGLILTATNWPGLTATAALIAFLAVDCWFKFTGGRK